MNPDPKYICERTQEECLGCDHSEPHDHSVSCRYECDRTRKFPKCRKEKEVCVSTAPEPG